MSAQKLTPIPFLLGLGMALYALPAVAQNTPTTPVMSFPNTNVQVEIDGQRKMQGERLYINQRQCLGLAAYEEANPPGPPAGSGDADAATGDAATGDAATGDGGTGGDGGLDASTSTDGDAGDDSGVSDASTAAFIAQPKAAQQKQSVTEDSAVIRITVSNLGQIAPSAQVLEFWMGTTGQDCSPSARQTNAPNRPQCKQVRIAPLFSFDTKTQVLVFRADQLFSDPYQAVSPDAEGFVPCNLQGPWSLFIVPLATATQASGTPAPSLSTMLKIDFQPDFSPLNAVGSVQGGSGETQVTVSWDMATGADSLTNYRVYYDTGATQPAGEGACTSSVLIEGGNLPFETSLAGLDERMTKGTSLGVDPQSLGIQMNQMIPAAVVALDAAGNTSKISNVVCVQHIDTDGFWDACNNDAKCKDGFDTCSLSVVRKSGIGGWLLWSLGAVGLALWIRRRRSV